MKEFIGLFATRMLPGLVIIIIAEIYLIHNPWAQWLAVAASTICLIIATILYALLPLFNHAQGHSATKYESPFQYSLMSMIGSLIIVVIAVVINSRANVVIYWWGIFGTAIIIPISTYVNCKIIYLLDCRETKNSKQSMHQLNNYTRSIFPR